MAEEVPDIKTHHTLTSLYKTPIMILVCDTCGWWELVGDIREAGQFRSQREIPCPCGLCESLGQTGTLHIVGDDDGLRIVKAEEE